ncbi:type II secretion system minor pseudopilin GspJ [Steroidobacter sp. S1-65]|uniref:Type II secretion system protein J n=1 Tax=Steroidobacter gossypii TaxID=2805490 RepID=A0ABS1WX63_9GAMM|nr:type II secretion system minor pseudopilin GspJ [Steroidobacter gossypii]MBM0105569.1 type II secretion system minor pseudopilin GspJ [Steroidobacter gossypii]
MNRARGITLVELLVAIFIFAIVAAIAMGGYNEMMKQSDIVNAGAGRTREIQAAMQRLNLDFTSLEPRPVREPLGDSLQPALRADTRRETIAELTHSSWSNPIGMPRSTLQRVAYRLEDTRLIREYWLALDRTMDSEPESAVLLERVKRVEMRFMDSNRAWHEQWPPLGYSAPDAPRLRPIAVEVTLELEDWGEIKRLMEVSG